MSKHTKRYNHNQTPLYRLILTTVKKTSYLVLTTTLILTAGCSAPDYVIENNLRMARGEYSDVIDDYSKRIITDPDNMANRYYLSQAYFQTNHLEKAKIEMDQVLIIDPLVGKYRLLAGKIHYARKTYFEAINHLITALNVNSQMVEGYYYLALSLNQVGKTGEALSRLNTAIQIEPLYFDARLAWIRLTFDQIKQSYITKEAEASVLNPEALESLISQLIETIRIQPDSPEAILLLAEIYQFSGKPAKAKSVLKEWVQTHSEQDSILIALSRLEYESAYFDSALAYLNRLIVPDLKATLLRLKIQLKRQSTAPVLDDALHLLTQHPNSSELHLLVSRIFLAKNDRSNAEKHIQQALQINPDDAEAYYYLSEIYRLQNDPAGARWALKRSVTNAPADPKITILYLSYLIEDERWIEANEFLKTNYLPETHPEVLFYKAILAKSQGAYAQARDLLVTAQNHTFSIRAETLLADIDIRQKKYVAAETRLNNLFKLYPQNAEIATTISRLYFETNRVDAVPNLLQPFINTPEINGNTQLMLAEALGRTGQIGSALKLLKKAINDWPSNQDLVQLYTFYLGLSGQYDTAIDILERLPSFHPKYQHVFYYRLRSFYYLSGRSALFKSYVYPYDTIPRVADLEN